MSDATTDRHIHAHDPDARDLDHGEAIGAAAIYVSKVDSLRPRPASAPLPVRAGVSALEASAGVRLLAILPVVALLWAGVYWALH